MVATDSSGQSNKSSTIINSDHGRILYSHTARNFLVSVTLSRVVNYNRRHNLNTVILRIIIFSLLKQNEG